MIYDKTTINILNNLAKKYPERFTDACNSLNDNQQKSKYWLVEKLNEYKFDFREKFKDKGIDALVLAGWYGVLAYILIEEFKLQKINSIDTLDYDPLAKQIGRILFAPKDAENLKSGRATFVNYKYKDIRQIKYDYLHKFSLVICTSCEHLNQKDIDRVIDKLHSNTLVVLQSNNYKDCNQHINLSSDVNEFKDRYIDKLDNVRFFVKPSVNYDRYMIIGTRKNKND